MKHKMLIGIVLIQLTILIILILGLKELSSQIIATKHIDVLCSFSDDEEEEEELPKEV